jgi:hypothetical protein
VNTFEELLERNSSGTDLENREYGRRDRLRWPSDTLHPKKKLRLTSPTRGGRSVGIVRSRTMATEFVYGMYLEEIRTEAATSFHSCYVSSYSVSKSQP